MKINNLLIIILFAGCSINESQNNLEGTWEMSLSKSGADTVFFTDKFEITEKYFLAKARQRMQKSNSLSVEDSVKAMEHAVQIYNVHKSMELIFRKDSTTIFNRKDLQDGSNYRPDTAFFKVSGDTVFITGITEALGVGYFIIQPNNKVLFRELEDESGKNILIEFKKEK